MFSSLHDLHRSTRSSHQSARNRKARRRICPLGFDTLESRSLLASVVGDFNGDGFADQAVGVPGEDVGSIVDAGAVNVIYGSLNGLTTRNDYWNQNRAGVPDVAEVDDQFGAGLAAGDFNDDGFSDLAIGAPGESIDAATFAGAVIVIYGSPSGLNAGTTALHPVDFLTQGAAGAGALGDLLDVAEASDRFGEALAAGNFTADVDGADDLVIGVPGENSAAGSVNVVYGSSIGLTAAGEQFINQNTTNIEGSSFGGDEFGFSLVAGYFNADDNADLAIGVPGEGSSAGSVNVIYSAGAIGLSATAVGGVGAADQLWDQSVLLDVPESLDLFGFALAAGDFNSDGIGDLAVGIPGEDASTTNDGAVSIIFGQPTGLSPTGEYLLTQSNSGEINEAGDQFGFSLAAGDFDGNGFTDIAIGLPFEDVDGNLDAGAVIVRYTNVLPQFWTQNVANIHGTAQASDVFGTSLAAGDYNGDGVPDLAIGVPGDNVGTIDNAGSVHAIYGNPSAGSTGLSSTFVPTQIWDQMRLGQGVAEAQDRFGGNLAASSSARFTARTLAASSLRSSQPEPAGEAVAPPSAPTSPAPSAPVSPPTAPAPAPILGSVREMLVSLFASSRKRRA